MSTSKSTRKRQQREQVRKALERAETNALIAEFAALRPRLMHAEESRGIPAVDATHRTGKRRRGNSVTKKAPRETTYLTHHYDVFNSKGEAIEGDARMIIYRRES